MDPTGRPWLVAAGAISAGVALLHLGIAAAGPRAYVYFGAADLAPLAAAGSPVPALLTAGLALVFGVWSWYAFAGAGLPRRRPPLLRPGLWVIGAVYAARGAAVVPEALALARGAAAPPARYAVFSLVALAAGLAYLAGAWRARGAAYAPGDGTPAVARAGGHRPALHRAPDSSPRAAYLDPA